MGGIIAPGIRISLNTLSDKASLIPKINLKNIKKVIYKETNNLINIKTKNIIIGQSQRLKGITEKK